MTTDSRFITNQEGNRLKDRFSELLKRTQFFDTLVGYFFISGFHALHSDFENIEKIRILIGLNTDRTTVGLLNLAKTQQEFELKSHAEMRESQAKTILDELQQSEESQAKEFGALKFVEWIKSKKLEVRAHPSGQIHAKLYIMTYHEDDSDRPGRVITGSSNFTEAGLQHNLEVNVELKDPPDYKFAQKMFNDLWDKSVPVSEEYIHTIERRSQFAHFTPYQLYLKFLYEYFRREINLPIDIKDATYPPEFKKLTYQLEAVANAGKILDEYGGVFLSDVVGLGKTYMSAMLALQLNEPCFIIAPPHLLRRDKPGTWPRVFSDFGVRHFDYESIGKLDALVQRDDLERYTTVFIDESHRFRTDDTPTWEALAHICRGKKVVLVSATPLNNTPKDILSQLKLFQRAKNSSIPNVRNLEAFFAKLKRNLRGLSRQTDRHQYKTIVKENARQTRERILKYVMVRRTRTEIAKYYGKDLEAQGFKFPEIAEPQPLFYKFNELERSIFDDTIHSLTDNFKYARYTPLTYYTGDPEGSVKQSQLNIAKFMKILAVKRLESSFHAFRLTLQRFINTYEQVITEFGKGRVFISKKHTAKIFELLDADNEEGINKLIEEDKGEQLSAGKFQPQFIADLNSDLEILKAIRKDWEQIDRDPKWLAFRTELTEKPLLKDSKLIIFTESQETAAYLADKIRSEVEPKTLRYSGQSTKAERDDLLNNFDANAKQPADDYRIVVSTDILAEGVNLHRSNVVINYDIPWNPTRLIQRVGRVNRVDTKFSTIYTFHFFPTDEGNDLIQLREAAEMKIHGFIQMLGRDSHLLTDEEELTSHELFAKWLSKKTLTGEDETETTELQYLTEIRNVRDQQPELFEQIKRLPKKARSTRSMSLSSIQEAIENKVGTVGDESTLSSPALVTYFRLGRLDKFFITCKTLQEPVELDFMTLAHLLKPTDLNEKRQERWAEFYELLERNRTEFVSATTVEADQEDARNRGRTNDDFILARLNDPAVKHCPQFTEDDELFIGKIISLLENGELPKFTTREIAKKLKQEENYKPLKVLAVLQQHIPKAYFKSKKEEPLLQPQTPLEVILSSLLMESE